MKIVQIDTHIYRGSRPEGDSDLYGLHSHQCVRNIVSLEEGWGAMFGRGIEEEAMWLRYGTVLSGPTTWLNRPLSSISAPSPEKIRSLVQQLVYLSNNGKVFFHCFSGVDRTGFLAAGFKILHHGIGLEEGWEDMVANGMHRRYQLLWRDAYVRMWHTLHVKGELRG